MKILKKIIYILALVLITSCGYEPIFSKKNYNFSIAKIDTYGDKKLSSKIARNLNNINKLNQLCDGLLLRQQYLQSLPLKSK